MFTMCPFPSLHGRCNAADVSGESSITLPLQCTKSLFSSLDFKCLLFSCRGRLAKTEEMGITLTILAGRFVYRCLCVRLDIRRQGSDAVGAYKLRFFGCYDWIPCLY